jgi:hypothetical protein
VATTPPPPPPPPPAPHGAAHAQPCRVLSGQTCGFDDRRANLRLARQPHRRMGLSTSQRVQDRCCTDRIQCLNNRKSAKTGDCEDRI